MQNNDTIKKIHFIGIGGSGTSAAAAIASKSGFEVTGCDKQGDTPYIEKIRKDIKEIFSEHDISHIEDADLVVVSPAILFNPELPELIEAQKKLPVITWEKFVGDYILPDKKTICIAGTHGKSTTSAMAAYVFDEAGLSPSALIGATVNAWGVNYKVGNGEYFIIEADEFNDNFLNYTPDVIVLNNIEFDHPDFFKDEEAVFDTFIKFVAKLKTGGKLIINSRSVGIDKLLKRLPVEIKDRIEIIDISKKELNVTSVAGSNTFEFDGDKYELALFGEHNVQNALGVITLARQYDISVNEIKSALKSFTGIGRRLQLIGEKNGIKIYDDYAHHPTAIRETLKALKQNYSDSRVWAIIEPHSFSRTKALLDEYKASADLADKVLVGPIYKARDAEDFGINQGSVINSLVHKDARAIDTFKDIETIIKNESKQGDIILVMGAGESYKWAEALAGAKEKIYHGAGVAVVRKDGAVLMQHRDDKPGMFYRDHWGYPAGSTEEGEDYKEAAERELIEETGYIPGFLHELVDEIYTREDGGRVNRHIYWTLYDEIQEIHCYEGKEMKFVKVEEFEGKKFLPGQERLFRLAIEKSREYLRNK